MQNVLFSCAAVGPLNVRSAVAVYTGRGSGCFVAQWYKHLIRDRGLESRVQSMFFSLLLLLLLFCLFPFVCLFVVVLLLLLLVVVVVEVVVVMVVVVSRSVCLSVRCLLLFYGDRSVLVVRISRKCSRGYYLFLFDESRSLSGLWKIIFSSNHRSVLHGYWNI